ncbi:MAG TPA: phosphomannomutase/phosphoglucomutase [Candidatus Humimicrobiaceae bacterium]|nr:phosphomannomutase/phosphoglucomutase [Candidatus Humimicrobiaceae bacterium]
MKINPNIFRAYDIRGIYPNDLNEEVASRIAKAFGELYSQAKKIVVARDPRLSSPSLAKAVKESLVEVGKEVIDINIAPDPLFYFSIFHYHFDGGIMVSGSHNPKEHNGLTLHIKKPGKEISEDVIGRDLEKIKGLILGNKESETFPQKDKITAFNPSQDYIDYVTSKITLKRPLKIIIDSGNGAVGFLPEKVFQKLGCQVKTLYGDFDGTFPHHLPDPYKEENLKDVREEVLRQKADIGFVYDCDGDRIGVLDSQGHVVSGDFCLLMLARQALQKKKGPIIHDMRVSKAFLDEMRKQGVETHFSVSHHNAIINKIIETDAVFGGEITLHFLFPLDYYLCDDALFASLKLAEIISDKEDFARYVDSLPCYCASPEVFIDTTDEVKFEIIENLQKYLRENNYNFIDVDGARINFSNGWALARAANTSPYIKCRFEGDTKEDLIEIEKKALEIFEKVGIPVTKKTRQELGL